MSSKGGYYLSLKMLRAINCLQEKQRNSTSLAHRPEDVGLYIAELEKILEDSNEKAKLYGC